MILRVLIVFALGTALGGWLSFRYFARPEKSACVAVVAPPPAHSALSPAASVAPRVAMRRQSPQPATGPLAAPLEEAPRNENDRECPPNILGVRSANPTEGTLFCRCTQAATEEGAVWGSGTYTGDSSICRAAKHAGYWRADGDDVRVTLREGQARYEASESFGVQTQSYDAFESSFTF